MRRTGSKRVNESPKLSLSLASALGRGRGPRGSTQQSFYKQCNKRDKPVLEDIDGDDFEFDAHTNNQEHEHEHEHGHSDGEVSINDDVSFHFDEIVNSNGGAGHDIIFGNENPSLSESAPSDTRRISVLGSKNMELTPVNTNSCMEVSFSECSKDSSVATSLSSSIGIKNTNHQIVRRLAGRYDNVLALISCHNNNLLGGQLLISSGADGTIVVWHSVLHTVVYYLIEHLKPVHALLVVPKDDTPGNHLVSGCNGGKIVVWDLDTGLLLRKIGFMDEESESDGVTCLALRKHPQCKRVLVVAGYMGGSIHIWDFEKNILIFSLQGHSNVVCALSVLEKNSQRVEREDDFFIVSSSQDSTIQVYDMQDQETETVVDKLKDFAQTKMTHMLSKKNKPSSKPKIMKSFYHMSTEESERSLDDEALSLHKPMKVFKGHEGSVRKFIMRPKQSCRNFGNYIISCGDDCTVRYWDVESETEVRILRGHSHKVSDICAREVEVNDSILNSPAIHQNYILVTASLDRTVVIWDGISGEALRCLLGHSEEVYSLCLVDKDVCKFDVVSAGSGGEVIMWNIDCQQDVCTMTLKDRTGNTPMGDYRTRAVSLNEFKKNFHDRSLICIRNCAITQQECEDEEISEPDSGDGESVKDSSSYTYISCHYGSNVITIYEGFAKRTMRASREFKITYPKSDNKDAEFDNNDDGDTLRITALSWLDIVDQKGKSNASYFILAGQSNGDINVMDCVNGSLVKVLSERTDEDHNDDRFAKNTAIVAICTRKLTQTEKSDIARHHIIAARRNGTIVIWDFESEDVCCHFRDHDEDILCLATLEVNFTLLDSLSDGGVRFTSLSSLQSTYDFGIVTGASSGMIKFWKFNVFGGGWMQCYEISTAMEDINHGGCGISSISILENDLIPLGQESAVRNLSNFQLVTGYLNGAINLWDIHSKSISMVIDEKKDIDMTLYKGGSDYAVVDVCVGKTTDGFDITCGRNNRDVVQWKNIDINNVPGYGILREYVKRKYWFSLHILYKRFGWMLFNSWQSNSETLFAYTLSTLKNRSISALVENVCVYNRPDSRFLKLEGDNDRKYVPSYCWLGVRTRRHGQSVLSACVEKRVYDDIKFTLDSWLAVFNSERIDLFDELQDSFHFHLSQSDLILVAEEYSPLFCDFLLNISSQKSNEWILGGRVRDKFRKREDNLKLKSFDRWYYKKYLDIDTKKTRLFGDRNGSDDFIGGAFWDFDQHSSGNLDYFDIVDTDGLSLIGMYEKLERETEYRVSIAEDPDQGGGCFQQLMARLFQTIRTDLGNTMDKRKARSQVLIEGRFMPLRNTLCENLVFLRACLATQNVEIFNTEVLNLTVDYAWRAYGRRGHSKHFISFLCFLLYAAIATFNFESLIVSERTFFFFLSSYSFAMGLQYILGICLVYLFYLEFIAVVTDAQMTNLLEALIFYFADVWNVVDLTSYSFNAVGVAIRLYNETDTNLSQIAFAISSVLMWLKLLYYFRAFKSTGPLVSMILQIMFESRFFLLILCISLFGFAQAFLVMGLYGTVGTALLQVFVMMLGDFSLDFGNSANESITTCFFVLFMVIVTVVFLNLLIAIMGDSYDRIKEKEIAQWRRQQAKSIIDETLLLTDVLKNRKSRSWFPSTLHLLRPLNNFTDADDGSEWQGKIAQLKRIITESEENLKKDNEKNNYRIDIVGRSVSNIDDATKKMESKLSQKIEDLSERVNDLMGKMDQVLDKMNDQKR